MDISTTEGIADYIERNCRTVYRKFPHIQCDLGDVISVGWVTFLELQKSHDPETCPLEGYVNKFFKKLLMVKLQAEKWINKPGRGSSWSCTSGFEENPGVLEDLQQDEENLETLTDILDAMGTLTPTERQYLECRYVLDMSWDEVRYEMGLNWYEIQQISKSSRTKVATALKK